MKARTTFILTTSILIGIISALVSLILPNQYTAKGLLVILRTADTPSTGFFTYEGSYAQQNAVSYTPTFLSVLQSPNNLESSSIGSDVKTISRLIKAKKEGSQNIAFSVKGQTPDEAQSRWNKITGTAIATHENLKFHADPLISINKTPGSPVVLRTYPQWYVVFSVGFLFSVILLTSLILIIRYIKEENDY